MGIDRLQGPAGFTGQQSQATIVPAESWCRRSRSPAFQTNLVDRIQSTLENYWLAVQLEGTLFGERHAAPLAALLDGRQTPSPASTETTRG